MSYYNIDLHYPEEKAKAYVAYAQGKKHIIVTTNDLVSHQDRLAEFLAQASSSRRSK